MPTKKKTSKDLLKIAESFKVRENPLFPWWREGTYSEKNTGLHHLPTDHKNQGPTICGIEIGEGTQEYISDMGMESKKFKGTKCKACENFDKLYQAVVYGRKTKAKDTE